MALVVALLDAAKCAAIKRQNVPNNSTLKNAPAPANAPKCV